MNKINGASNYTHKDTLPRQLYSSWMFSSFVMCMTGHAEINRLLELTGTKSTHGIQVATLSSSTCDGRPRRCVVSVIRCVLIVLVYMLCIPSFYSVNTKH